jgi:malate synthase
MPYIRGEDIMETNIMKAGALLDPRFLAFYQPLHEKYTIWQQQIAHTRANRTMGITTYKLRVGYQDEYEMWPGLLQGNSLLTKPKFPKDIEKDFYIQIPSWCSDQRNQMTGPIDDAALVVKMLNSGAPGVMVDAEDSQANQWDNTSKMINNLFQLFQGKVQPPGGKRVTPPLTYTKNGKQFGIKTDTPTVLWFRPRGLHMSQVLRFPMSLSSVTTSASLFDVAVAAFSFSTENLPCKEQPLCIYIPKTEYAEEALWWDSLFKDLAHQRGWPEDSIKCMALVEAHSLAYQAEEFIWNLKDHIVGLNLGRWDYMASLIDQNLWDPKWVLPDRNTIPHDVAFFQNLRKHLVNVCHKHGILAIGGMTALYPSRSDSELNTRALKGLEADKKNEAQMGMDGAWTGHPDQNKIAVDQFPEPNQLEVIHDDLPDQVDLRPPLEGGSVTEDGTRQCIRVAIRYRNGVLNGKGASLLDGYMEDLATDRICRLMVAQRLQHLPDHDHAVIRRLFDEELERLLEEGGEVGTEETLRKARLLTEQYVVNGYHNPA